MFTNKALKVCVLRSSLGLGRTYTPPRLSIRAQCLSSAVSPQQNEGQVESVSVKPRTNIPFTKELFLGKFDKVCVILFLQAIVSD